MLNRLFPDDIDVVEMFAGGGGSGTGIAAVPGTKIKFAANHAKPAKWTYVENHPDVDFWLGDVQAADAIEKFPYASFFWASPACFVAGTLILTRRGLVPIEEVREGDEVFTHQRRWRLVTGTMSKLAPTVIVSGKGFHLGIETTAEHPFYTRKRTRTWDNDAHTYRHSVADESEWTEAKDLGPGTWWATPTDFGEALPVPDVGGRGMEFTPEFWWMVGRWVGDGWLRAKRSTKLDPSPRRRSQPADSPCVMCGGKTRQHGKSTTGRVRWFCSDMCRRASVRRNPHHGRYDLAITCGYHELEDLAQRLDGLDGLTWQRGRTKTAARFVASHRGLVEWMAEHFGQHAHGKTIPAWAMTMPRAWREALLDGYMSADGTKDAKYTRASTVSKKLAIGIRMLANSLGHVANLGYQPARKRQRVIEGRAVNERPTWTVSWVTAGPQRFQYAEAEGYRWSNTHHPASTGRLELVYNIHVAEDESYVADGITVHNCPAFSTASGETRYFDRENQMALWADDLDNLTEHQKTCIRSRALMEEVVTYLRHCQEKHGKPVLGFGVENVVQARLWAHWDRWIRELRKLGYIIQIHAVNAAHVQGRTTRYPPRSPATGCSSPASTSPWAARRTTASGSTHTPTATATADGYRPSRRGRSAARTWASTASRTASTCTSAPKSPAKDSSSNRRCSQRRTRSTGPTSAPRSDRGRRRRKSPRGWPRRRSLASAPGSRSTGSSPSSHPPAVRGTTGPGEWTSRSPRSPRARRTRS
ncbi:Hint domain-containing protein [Nonomuraea sp. NPDC049028]|uniref:Hint domain-containing protein n=1 Tax=Nonomuraea sp. NPDC049028 TaxID=3364348 RepID=UPI003717CDCF